MEKVPTEIELLEGLMNSLNNKEEEMEKMQEKTKLVYDNKNKVWMEEGAIFRQISQKEFYNEVDRIRKVFSKLSTIKEPEIINVAESYIFNNREVFVKLFNNLKKGGYVVTRKDENSITLGKEWYSFGMRSNYYHSVQFSKSKDGEYVIGDIRDRRILNDYSKKRKYGRKYLPITKVGL